MEKHIVYKIADTEADFEEGKKLFREYVESLGIDLSFQDFNGELETIADQYSAPTGALVIAFDGPLGVGCAGVRSLDTETAELKRMYVKDAYRGHRIGMEVLERSLQIAGELGYQKIRLDSLQHMTKAITLYRSYGFYEIPAYRFNPLDGAVYMEKVIADQ